MKPSEQAKAAGFKSLKELSEVCAVGVSTLCGWHKRKPVFFEVVVAGSKVLKDSKVEQKTERPG